MNCQFRIYGRTNEQHGFIHDTLSFQAKEVLLEGEASSESMSSYQVIVRTQNTHELPI